RLKIHEYLLENDDIGLYHFKLFNEEELELLGRYDGFRLFEFQFNNASILCSKNMMHYSPMLNDRNFCNSIFIQIVYEFLKTEVNGSLIDDVINSKKIMERIERNKEILRVVGKSNSLFLFEGNVINFYKSCDKLFAFFLDIASRNILNAQCMNWFIRQYFERFRHEYINKYYVYKNVIERKLNERVGNIFFGDNLGDKQRRYKKGEKI
ncbi:MAG: hypothetical protein OEW87_15580, partial [Flavobacteriaceae bacterium]|nr:hypothetical protein [Flavobacteriaceae bacterium]